MLNLRHETVRDTVREEVVVAVHDTIREITTITVTLREPPPTAEPGAAPDTVFKSVVTDRTRARERDRSQLKDERLVVRTDTVYVAVKDSVQVQKFNGSRVQGDKPPAFVSVLKWIFFIIVGLVALIITIKVCLRRSLF